MGFQVYGDKNLQIYLISAAIFFLIGFIDDLFKLSAYFRLSFQIIVSTIILALWIWFF